MWRGLHIVWNPHNSHFGYTCRYCMKKSKYALHVISLEFTGKSLQILIKLIIQILPKNVYWNCWNINTILHLDLSINTELITCTIYICFSNNTYQCFLMEKIWGFQWTLFKTMRYNSSKVKYFRLFFGRIEETKNYILKLTDL